MQDTDGERGESGCLALVRLLDAASVGSGAVEIDPEPLGRRPGAGPLQHRALHGEPDSDGEHRQGIGTFFHKNYQAAENGESVMRPVFVGWYENENYAQFRHTQGGRR